MTAGTAVTAGSATPAIDSDSLTPYARCAACRERLDEYVDRLGRVVVAPCAGCVRKAKRQAAARVLLWRLLFGGLAALVERGAADLRADGAERDVAPRKTRDQSAARTREWYKSNKRKRSAYNRHYYAATRAEQVIQKRERYAVEREDAKRRRREHAAKLRDDAHPERRRRDVVARPRREKPCPECGGPMTYATRPPKRCDACWLRIADAATAPDARDRLVPALLGPARQRSARTAEAERRTTERRGAKPPGFRSVSPALDGRHQKKTRPTLAEPANLAATAELIPPPPDPQTATDAQRNDAAA